MFNREDAQRITEAIDALVKARFALLESRQGQDLGNYQDPDTGNYYNTPEQHEVLDALTEVRRALMGWNA